MRFFWIAGITLCLAVVLCFGFAVYLAEVTTLPQHHRAPALDLQASAVAEATGSAASVARIRGSDGAPLEATIFVPEPKPESANLEAPGAVLLLHGLGDTRAGMLWKAGLLLRQGFVILVPDLRAHGVSGGDRMTYGYLEAQDAASWAAWLSKHFHPKRLFTMGHSLGGAVALQTLAVANIDAVIAEAPFSEFSQIAGERIEQMIGFSGGGLLGRPIAQLGFLWSSYRFKIELNYGSPLAAVSNSNVPVLLIHGTRDENISVEHSRRLRDSNPRRVHLWEIPGAHHNDIPSVAGPTYEERIVQWFRLFAEMDNPS